MPHDLLREFDRPAASSYASTVISVRTAVSGRTADFVETEVTHPLEKALLEVRGAKLLRSSSRSELSVIEIGVNSDRVCEALSSTVAAIANVRKKLSTTTGEPSVTLNPEVKCP